MGYSNEARGWPVRVFLSRYGGWRLRDANGETVADEFGEPYEYATEQEAAAAMAKSVDERAEKS